MRHKIAAVALVASVLLASDLLAVQSVVLLTRATPDAMVDYFSNLLTQNGIAFTPLTPDQVTSDSVANAVIIAGFSTEPIEYSGVAATIASAVSQGSWMIAEAFGLYVLSYAGIGKASPSTWGPAVLDKYGYVAAIDTTSPLFAGIPEWDPPVLPDEPSQYRYYLLQDRAIPDTAYVPPALGVEHARCWAIAITYGWPYLPTDSPYCKSWGGCTPERSVGEAGLTLIHHGDGMIFVEEGAQVVPGVFVYGPIQDAINRNFILWAWGFSLVVTKAGTGSGLVASDPQGIDCGATCSVIFARNTTVSLTASPAGGGSFSGWSGDCTGTGPCILIMDAPKSVAATFRPAQVRRHLKR